MNRNVKEFIGDVIGALGFGLIQVIAGVMLTGGALMLAFAFVALVEHMIGG